MKILKDKKYQIFIFVTCFALIQQAVYASMHFSSQQVLPTLIEIQKVEQLQTFENFIQLYKNIHKEWYFDMEKLLLQSRYIAWRQKIDLQIVVLKMKKSSFEDVSLNEAEENVQAYEKYVAWIDRCIKGALLFLSDNAVSNFNLSVAMLFADVPIQMTTAQDLNLAPKVMTELVRPTQGLNCLQGGPRQNKPSVLQIFNDPDL